MVENQDHLDTTMTEPAPPGWAFWLQWVLANTVGSLLGLVVAVVVLFLPVFILAYFSHFETLPSWIILFVSVGSSLGGAAMGTAVGIGQRLVLRRHGWRAERWIRVTVLGRTVSGFAVTVLVLTLGWSQYGVLWQVGLFLHGALVGFVQFLLLRRWVNRAGWWILANAVGLYSLGVITGGVLVWLLRRHPVPPGSDEA